MVNPSNHITLEYLESLGLDNGMTQGILDKHKESVDQHVAYVQEACELLGGLPQYQVRAHDLSKYTLAEFPHYARQFQGPKNDPDGFAYAWMHHIHHNPHHWQHWIFGDGHTPKGSNVQAGVMQMPSNYVVEMVADWMGASKAYTGSWDMEDWLLKNLPKIKIHTQTAQLLENILTETLGYQSVFIALRTNNLW